MTASFNGMNMEMGLLLILLLMAAGVWLCLQATKRCSAKLRTALIALRTLSLLVCCVIILNPGTWKQPEKEEPGWWAILTDSSTSMQVTDCEEQSRWHTARDAALRAMDTVDHPEQLNVYTFDETMHSRSREELETMAAEGSETRLTAALRNILRERLTGLRGIVLLSDGRSTDGTPGEQLAGLARSANIPCYALPLGGHVNPPDLSVTVQQPYRTAFLNQPHPMTVHCRSGALPPLRTSLQVVDDTGAIITNVPVELEQDSTVPVSFEITPTRAGYQRYQISMEPHASEKQLVNNSGTFGITTLTNAVRILLAEGTPYWDSKFLARFLRSQPQFSVTALYHISADRTLVLMPESEEPTQASGSAFPETAEQLGHYDLIIFGKNCDVFLDEERVELLKTAVREQGLGVVFARSKPYEGIHPEIAELEPVEWGSSISHPFRFMPVDDNSLFGDSLPPSDSDLWKKFPSLSNAHQIRSLRAFSEVLAEGRMTANVAKTFPALIYRRYGHGLVLTLNAEGFWHWDFFPKNIDSRDIYRDIWSQLLLWTATHSEFLPGRDYALELSASSVEQKESVSIRVQSRAAQNTLLEPVVRVLHNNRELTSLPLAADPSRPNRWSGVFVPDTPGVYQLELTDTFEIIPEGISQMLQVATPPTEQDNLSADPEALQRFCTATDGDIISLDAWDELITQLDTPQQSTVEGRAVWTPLWDRTLLFLLIAALLALEWFLRRRNGLL